MRFQDWDCLLFPSASANTDGQIPLQEFRTTCHAIQEGYQINGAVSKDGLVRAANVSPLLTCFVPSQQPESAFYISLHCWSNASQYLADIPDNELSGRKSWRMQVKLDGVCMIDELIPSHALWPRSFNKPDRVDHIQHCPLTFPSFNRKVADARAFDPAEDFGRIKVELHTGTLEEQNGAIMFNRISKIVTFAFVHAPQEHLERCGIAWPNPAMFNNPIVVPSPADIVTGPALHAHFEQQSSPSKSVPAAPPSTPTLGIMPSALSKSLETDSCYDSVRSRNASLRSSSSSLRLISQHSTSTYGQSSLVESMPEWQDSQHFAVQRKDSKCMPPPAMPASAMARQATQSLVLTTPVRNSIHGSDNGAAACLERRVESHGSDVSMHTTCQHFPACTSEDEHGRIVHESPVPPLTAIKTRRDVNAMSTSEG